MGATYERQKHRRYWRHRAVWRPRWQLRVGALLVAFAALVSGLVVVGAPEAQALPRGETLTLPGGTTISNFVLPNGKRAYCIEINMGEPTGHAWFEGKTSILPGRTGVTTSWGNPAGMRQMNYLIDRYGQNKDAWTAGAVQLTIWRMRENFGTGNPQMNRTIAALQTSQQGRDLIKRSDQLYADAVAKAKAPVDAPNITGSLAIGPDPAGVAGRYRVAYPKGTTSLSVSGGTFVRNGAKTLSVGASEASARYVDVTPGAAQIKATGTWQTLGVAGWEPQLDVYGTLTAAGATGQRVAVATGESSRPKRNGSFVAVTIAPPPAALPPVASSQAQPSAEVGGTVRDELRVRAQQGSAIEMWPSATASFTAYLQPVAGTVKYNDQWQPQMGPVYEAQAEDPATGELRWSEWWANERGDVLLDASGEPIAVLGPDGLPTFGVDGAGLAYPVPELDDAGEPIIDGAGAPVYYTKREPVMEFRQDQLLWTESELEGLSSAQRCVAQPVFHEDGIPVPAPGTYASSEVTVKSGGTVHWVERVYSRGAAVHEGVCGLANETTRINQPGVVTQAPTELLIGDVAYDVATVSGTLLPDVNYSLRFEAYRAPDDDLGETVPSCTVDNLVFRSELVPVTGTGDVRSPSFIVGSEHGTKLWWVETLQVEGEAGLNVVHRGACGLENETTRIAQPTVETQAMADAVVGGMMTDTAILGGDFAVTEGARWELEFQGYRANLPEPEEMGDESEAPADQAVAVLPQCDADNLLFGVPPVEVTGPGSVTSAPVRVLPEWKGQIWWVETLWLIEGGRRTPYVVGQCGIANETTFVTGIDVTTEAMPVAAVGDAVYDTATVVGDIEELEGASYELRFEAFEGTPELTGQEAALCTADNLIWTDEPVTVSAAGTFTSAMFTALPAHGSIIWWVESLWVVESGEEDLLLHRGICGVEHETTRVASPSVATVAPAQLSVGEQLFDTAYVEGPLSQRDDIEYRLRFSAYERSATGEMVCDVETELRALSDLEGVVVTGPGSYTSRPVTAQAEHVGLGGFVETLVLIEEGKEYLVHRGACGEASESFEIVPVAPPKVTPPQATPPTSPPVPTQPAAPRLPETGSTPGVLWGVAGSLIFLGLVVSGLRARQQRRKNL